MTMPDRSERSADHERKKRDRQDQAPDLFLIRRFEGHSQTPVYLVASSIQRYLLLGLLALDTTLLVDRLLIFINSSVVFMLGIQDVYPERITSNLEVLKGERGSLHNVGSFARYGWPAHRLWPRGRLQAACAAALG